MPVLQKLDVYICRSASRQLSGSRSLEVSSRRLAKAYAHLQGFHFNFIDNIDCVLILGGGGA
jgi:hypothetical protein